MSTLGDVESGASQQPLASEESVVEVVREALGSQTTVDPNEWHVRKEHYVVASVETTRPSMRLVVKLEIPGECLIPLDRSDQTAQLWTEPGPWLHRLVRSVQRNQTFAWYLQL